MDADIFTQLKDELARQLDTHSQSKRDPAEGWVNFSPAKGAGLKPSVLVEEPARAGMEGQRPSPTSSALRLVSAPPTGKKNKVSDLSYTGTWETGFTLTWSYVNVGDYNQDGTVSIADITPLAENFQETAEGEGDSWRGWIDGDGNGVINIGDITPLAQNFFVQCEGYLVQGSATGDANSFITTANIPFSDSSADGGRRRFIHSLTPTGYRYLRVMPIDPAGLPGEASNVLELPEQPPPPPEGDPPEIVSISPDGGDEGTQVVFVVELTGDAPFTFLWDFGGAGEPNTSNYASPPVTLGAPGTYTGHLTVTNDYGTDETDFPITVNPVPKWHVTVVEGPGYVGEYCTLAEVNGAPAIAYGERLPGGALFNIKYVRARDSSGEQWNTPVVLERDVKVAQLSSVVISVVKGNPAVVYSRQTDDPFKKRLVFMRALDALGTSWGEQIVVEEDYADLVPDPSLHGFLFLNGLPTFIAGLKYYRAIDEDGSQRWEVCQRCSNR